MHHNTKNLSRLLKTARGQIDGIIKMIEEDRDCIDISSQISASQSILKKVNIEILSSHLSHCIKESFEHGNEQDKQAKIDEFVTLLSKIMKG